MDETLREFFNEVYEITRQIPLGKVLTYGKIAILAGRPQHARWVGRAMALAPDDTLPCHRVVNSIGETAPWEIAAPDDDRYNQDHSPETGGCTR